MRNIIFKDLLFYRGYFIVFLPFLIFITVDTYMYDYEHYFYILFVVLSYAFISLQQSFRIDDKEYISSFLKTLPIKNDHIVLSKYLLLLLLLLFSFIVFITPGIFIYYISGLRRLLDINLNLFALSSWILFGAAYLFLYFKKSYKSAQNISYLIVVIIPIGKYTKNVFSLDMNPIITILFFILSLYMFFLSYCYSKKAFSYKE